MVVGPRVRLRFEVHGTEGALAWELERMNELQRSRLPEDGSDEGYTTVFAGPGHGQFGAFQPGAGIPMGYDDLRVIEAGNFLAAVRDGEQRGPGPGRDGRDGPRPARDRALQRERRLGGRPGAGGRRRDDAMSARNQSVPTARRSR